MSPRRIGEHIGEGPEPEEERAERQRRESLRDAFARWPTGVAILAVRDGDDVHALTVGALIPVSFDPPLLLVSLGPNAAALPYLAPDTPFAVSILAADQRGLAARYADTLPVGPSPFPDEGPPVVKGSITGLSCSCDELLPRGDHTLVIARVDDVHQGVDDAALAYFRRGYHRID